MYLTQDYKDIIELFNKHDLIRNKEASNRPKDRLDLVQLKALALLKQNKN